MFRPLAAGCNGFTADTIRFVPFFEQLRVSWTTCSPMSAGMEKFVDEYFPKIKANNPNIEFTLARTHTVFDPFLVGVYNHNRMKKYRCSWRTAEQILAMVEEMSIGGDYRSGRKRGVNTKLPRGTLLLSTETMGHDVFQVYSKYKGDLPPRDAIKSHEHPHYIYKKHV